MKWRTIERDVILFPDLGVVSTKFRDNERLNLVSVEFEKADVFFFDWSQPWLDAGVESGDKDLGRLF